MPPLSTLLFAAFFLLCLSIKRHFRQLLPDDKFTRIKSRRFSVIGYSFLFLGFMSSVIDHDFSIAIVYFLGMFSLVLLVIAIGLPYLSQGKVKKRKKI